MLRTSELLSMQQRRGSCSLLCQDLDPSRGRPRLGLSIATRGEDTNTRCCGRKGK
ncbi:hypothetical protein AXF42_Ash021479 [Apostasia shenzhenica]|uniref:Uncharacterized protein n=1 Tax=Apostasia shenzhenica TaxID=1088818 RepID=A0A2H9ZZS7_9ASPA|nr:hypothetical protein AXF42_Ash021479 [Apostasia shenzhenica]